MKLPEHDLMETVQRGVGISCIQIPASQFYACGALSNSVYSTELRLPHLLIGESCYCKKVIRIKSVKGLVLSSYCYNFITFLFTSQLLCCLAPAKISHVVFHAFFHYCSLYL